MRRLALVAAGIAVAVALFVLLRPGDDDAEDAVATTPTTTAPATRAPATTETTVEPPPPTTPPKPVIPIVRVTIRDGELVGGLRTITIKRGRTFVLIVRSDVSDHVHVHGLDVFEDVGPAQPARFRLTPRVAGRYEVELEDRHFLIAQLNVTQ